VRPGTVPTIPNTSAPWAPEDSPTPIWPLLSHLQLQAASVSVPAARRHARAVTTAWGLSALADEVELTVSELVTNAIEAATKARPAPRPCPVPVRLWLASDLDAILVRVWDSSPEVPQRRDTGPDDERGRGLLLVAALCRAWGMYGKGSGKVTWVVI
jgi:anti-sigma regulatory factor (Ser/Thr protein kinase)